MTFREWQKKEFGYDCITTFWEDFSIADRFGVDAVIDTFDRTFNEWKTNYKYLTELVIVLNHKCWHYFGKNNALSKIYADLYKKASSYASETLEGEEFAYYWRITD